MKIAVILRQGPEMTEELELTDDGSDIDREWIGLVLNQFDDQALEQAVLLKESAGAEVTALAVEDEGTERLLRTALARGADKVWRIPLDEEAPRASAALAPLYVEAIRQLDTDLVLTGVLSVDDLFGELAPLLGAGLKWPQVSAVSDMKFDQDRLVVRQEYSGGRAALLGLGLPAVIGLQTAAQPPRYVAGSKMRDLLKTEIPELSLKDGLVGAPRAASRLAVPSSDAGAEMIGGDAEAIAAGIADILKQNGLV